MRLQRRRHHTNIGSMQQGRNSFGTYCVQWRDGAVSGDGEGRRLFSLRSPEKRAPKFGRTSPEEMRRVAIHQPTGREKCDHDQQDHRPQELAISFRLSLIVGFREILPLSVTLGAHCLIPRVAFTQLIIGRYRLAGNPCLSRRLSDVTPVCRNRRDRDDVCGGDAEMAGGAQEFTSCN